MSELPNHRGAVRLREKFARFTDTWSPRRVGHLNDYAIKVARLAGEFVWHKHDDTDELFLVHAGSLVIRYRDREVKLSAGDLHVVPRGQEHLPVVESGECLVLLIEPATTINTGDAGGPLTASSEPFI